MQRPTVTVAILIIIGTMIIADQETDEPDQCVSKWMHCTLSSPPCCQEKNPKTGSSEEVHCDYLGTTQCKTADDIYRYRDTPLIEELKDDPDFRKDYIKYVQSLAKIQQHLDLKRFMNRIHKPSHT